MGLISSNSPTSTIILPATMWKSCCTIFHENTTITNRQNIILVRFFNSLPKKADTFLNQRRDQLTKSQSTKALSWSLVPSMQLLRPEFWKGNTNSDLKQLILLQTGLNATPEKRTNEVPFSTLNNCQPCSSKYWFTCIAKDQKSCWSQ